ncbi:hypothetical protein NKI41_21120 [Mesorhizobium sp. M0601]|uniref:hypothetical protein n=1 Tax=Mesorhizobium sp. M0601 TaxID=2956969 RepID=UPI0033386DCA
MTRTVDRGQSAEIAKRAETFYGADGREGGRFSSIQQQQRELARMPNEPLRLVAFFAVVLALLNSGYFHQGDIVATIYFMIGAILVTAVTRMSIRRQLI